MRRPLTIDVHAHVYPRGLPEFASASGDARWPALTCDDDGGRIVVNGQVARKVDDQYWSVARRLELMDELGIDVQVLSPLPLLLPWWGSGELAASWCQVVNEAVAEMVAESPHRFVGFGILPTNDHPAAIAELAHLRQLGLVGVEIGTALDEERTCGDPSLEPLFEHLAAADVPVLIHPVRRGLIRGLPASMEAVVGLPVDTMLAMLPMVWPTAITAPRTCVVHGGGTLPWVWPRLCNLAGRDDAELPAWFYADTAAVSGRQVEHLASILDRHRVLFGSDCPAVRQGLIRPLLAELSALGDLGSDVLHRNPLQFLGHPPP